MVKNTRTKMNNYVYREKYKDKQIDAYILKKTQKRLRR